MPPQDFKEEEALWLELKALKSDDPLPERLPELFYTRLGCLIRCGEYADRIEPFLEHFPREKCVQYVTEHLLCRLEYTYWHYAQLQRTHPGGCAHSYSLC